MGFLFAQNYPQQVYMQLTDSNTPNMTIMVADTKRQHDKTNCAISALTMLNYFSKMIAFFKKWKLMEG